MAGGDARACRAMGTVAGERPGPIPVSASRERGRVRALATARPLGLRGVGLAGLARPFPLPRLVAAAGCGSRARPAWWAEGRAPRARPGRFETTQRLPWLRHGPFPRACSGRRPPASARSRGRTRPLRPGPSRILAALKAAASHRTGAARALVSVPLRTIGLAHGYHQCRRGAAGRAMRDKMGKFLQVRCSNLLARIECSSILTRQWHGLRQSGAADAHPAGCSCRCADPEQLLRADGII
jgi:hypothetical protein